LRFGKKNIFVLTGMIAGMRAPNLTLVANHRRAIRNTRVTSRASQAIGLR
jgi:hypothetical protein